MDILRSSNHIYFVELVVWWCVTAARLAWKKGDASDTFQTNKNSWILFRRDSSGLSHRYELRTSMRAALLLYVLVPTFLRCHILMGRRRGDSCVVELLGCVDRTTINWSKVTVV